MDGLTTEFSIIMNLIGNGAFWTNPVDAFAQGLFTQSEGHSMDPRPGALSGVDPNAANNDPDPVGRKLLGNHRIWDKIKHVGKKIGQGIWKHREATFNAGSKIIGLLD